MPDEDVYKMKRKPSNECMGVAANNFVTLAQLTRFTLFYVMRDRYGLLKSYSPSKYYVY